LKFIAYKKLLKTIIRERLTILDSGNKDRSTFIEKPSY